MKFKCEICGGILVVDVTSNFATCENCGLKYPSDRLRKSVNEASIREGDVLYGTVKRIMQFGAFVELAPGQEGLIHISKLSRTRVSRVEDVCQIGDTVKVLVTDIDGRGRINLSIKDAVDLEVAVSRNNNTKISSSTQMKQCSECGTFSTEETVFCYVCGKRFPQSLDIVPDNAASQFQGTGNQYIVAEAPVKTRPEIDSLLQRIELFLEDGEFNRANEYCERVLDMEPTNAEAYIGKLLVEFGCRTRDQLKNCTSSIANSKNFAKVVRFGNEEQKAFVTGAEKSIQDSIAIIDKETEKISTQEVDLTTAEQIIESDQQRADPGEMEEYYIDIYCPYCHEELSYTDWQIREGELTCPMCDAHFLFDEGMRI